MKRVLIMSAVLALSAPLFAQKANVKKVKSMIEYAATPVNKDFSNLAPDKLQEVRDLIMPALTDPESATVPETWKYAIRLKVNEMNTMLKERAANNNEFVDKAAFFLNQADIVCYAETYYKLLNTPNEKGKLPLKDDERKKEEADCLAFSKNARNNLFIGASNLVYDNPETTVKLLDQYYESFDNPLYAELNLKETDPYYNEGSFIYATALKGAKGDEAKMVEYLNKSLDSKNGALACQELINYYKGKNDTENVNKVYETAFEKFPEQVVFGINIAQNAIQAKEYDKAIQYAEKQIERIESGVIKSTNDAGEDIEAVKYPFYFRAIALYNKEKYKEAYDAFCKAVDFRPDYYDCIVGAGSTATRIASLNKDKKAVANEWYTKAINHYLAAKEMAPEKSNDWGYPLYASYYNTGKMEDAKKYQKFAK